MGFAYNIVADKLTALSSKDRTGLLLKREERGVPQRVSDALDFLDSHNIWYIVSRNSPATSCRDAASRRLRLGSTGIPLSDELKSHFVAFYDQNGERKYVILHCRGNQRFDLLGISQKLEATRPLARLAADELKRIFNSEYGTVTPFLMDKVTFQIFDEGLLHSISPPHTMMTNAGDYTWAVELKPKNLIDSLAKAYPGKIRVDNIVETSKTGGLATDVRFGIISGNGPESGMALWKHLNRNVAESLNENFKGDLSFPPVIIYSIPEMGLSMELEPREFEVWHHLSCGVHQLCKNRITHMAVACHTTHYFSERLRKLCLEYGVEFVSMAETTIKYIKSLKISDLTVIGIPYVADLGSWSAYKELSSLNIRAVNRNARESLLELGYWVKKVGSDNTGLNKLRHILRIGVETEYVLIALTEISVLLEGFPKQRKALGRWKIIDPLELYGEKLAQIFTDSLSSVFSVDLDGPVET